MNTKYSLSMALAVTILSSLITACGGGTDTAKAGSSTPSEPIEITSASWKNTSNKSLRAISLKAHSSKKDDIDRRHIVTTRHTTHFTINGVDGSNIDANKHWQIYVDMDNDRTTGYQGAFNGADYLIEDSILYQSTANDDSWSWKVVEVRRSYNGHKLQSYIPALSVETTSNQLLVNLDMDYYWKSVYSRYPFPTLKDWFETCKNIKIGFTEFDANWKIDTYYPYSNQLLSQNIDYCNIIQVNQKPTVKIIGSKVITIDRGTIFKDPGFTAQDAEDGDITDKVKTSIVVAAGTKSYPVKQIGPGLGTYYISYDVKDSAGARASASRRVHVRTPKPNDIVVDGIGDEWNVPPAGESSVHQMAVYMTEDKDNVFIMVKADKLDENFQIYIDTDYNLISGFDEDIGSGSNRRRIGAEMLIENGIAYYHNGTRTQWKWDNAPDIDSVRIGNTFELSIPKSTLKSTKKRIDILLTTMDKNWHSTKNSQGNYVVMGTYSLSYKK